MPEHVTSRRVIIAGAGGIAAVAALSTAATALPGGFEPSSDFHEIRRLVGLVNQAWKADHDDETKEVNVAQIEVSIDAIERRLLSRPPTTLSDLLCHAALVLYWSDAFNSRAFDEPVAALKRQAGDGDCFESRALRLTAAVFELARGEANV